MKSDTTMSYTVTQWVLFRRGKKMGLKKLSAITLLCGFTVAKQDRQDRRDSSREIQTSVAKDLVTPDPSTPPFLQCKLWKVTQKKYRHFPVFGRHPAHFSGKVMCPQFMSVTSSGGCHRPSPVIKHLWWSVSPQRSLLQLHHCRAEMNLVSQKSGYLIF